MDASTKYVLVDLEHVNLRQKRNLLRYLHGNQFKAKFATSADELSSFIQRDESTRIYDTINEPYSENMWTPGPPEDLPAALSPQQLLDFWTLNVFDDGVHPDFEDKELASNVADDDMVAALKQFQQEAAREQQHKDDESADDNKKLTAVKNKKRRHQHMHQESDDEPYTPADEDVVVSTDEDDVEAPHVLPNKRFKNCLECDKTIEIGSAKQTQLYHMAEHALRAHKNMENVQLFLKTRYECKDCRRRFGFHTTPEKQGHAYCRYRTELGTPIEYIDRWSSETLKSVNDALGKCFGRKVPVPRARGKWSKDVTQATNNAPDHDYAKSDNDEKFGDLAMARKPSSSDDDLDPFAKEHTQHEYDRAAKDLAEWEEEMDVWKKEKEAKAKKMGVDYNEVVLSSDDEPNRLSRRHGDVPTSAPVVVQHRNAINDSNVNSYRRCLKCYKNVLVGSKTLTRLYRMAIHVVDDHLGLDDARAFLKRYECSHCHKRFGFHTEPGKQHNFLVCRGYNTSSKQPMVFTDNWSKGIVDSVTQGLANCFRRKILLPSPKNICVPYVDPTDVQRLGADSPSETREELAKSSRADLLPLNLQLYKLPPYHRYD